MIKIKLVDIPSGAMSSFEVPDAISAVDCSDTLIQTALYVGNSGVKGRTSVSGKSRGLVSGSTRKIYRQKGTGSARHGSIRVPQFRSGGMAFPGFPRKSLTLGKRSKLIALVSLFNRKCINGQVIAVSSLDLAEPKTRRVKELFSVVSDKFELKDGRNAVLEKDKCLFVKSAEAVELSGLTSLKTSLPFRNLRSACCVTAGHLSIFALARHDVIVVEEKALQEFISRISVVADEEDPVIDSSSEQVASQSSVFGKEG